MAPSHNSNDARNNDARTRMIPASPATPVAFDGETFTIGKEMLKAALKGSPNVALAKTVAALALASPLVAAAYLLMLNSSISSYLIARWVPFVMGQVDKNLALIKSELLKNIKGKVLDVGAGGGAYLKYYTASRERVSHVVLLEPNKLMHPNLKDVADDVQKDAPEDKRFTHSIVSELLHEFPAEENGTYDSVVLGNVLCEVDDPKRAVQEVYRLLKPGGRAYFVEHVAFERGTVLYTAQRWFNAVWRVLLGGCNCDRESHTAFGDVGFTATVWELPLNPGPIFAARTMVGVAVKPRLKL